MPFRDCRPCKAEIVTRLVRRERFVDNVALDAKVGQLRLSCALGRRSGGTALLHPVAGKFGVIDHSRLFKLSYRRLHCVRRNSPIHHPADDFRFASSADVQQACAHLKRLA